MRARYLISCVSLAILSGLPHRALGQTAISIPPSTNWDGNDGPWSSFTVQIGTPGQSVRVLPSSSGSALWAVVKDGCTKNDPSSCENDRGDFFNSQSSFSYSPVGTFELPLLAEAALGVTGNGEFGYDNLILSYPGGNGPAVNHSVVAGIATKDLFLGTMGLTPWGTNFTNLNDPQASILTLLRETNQIPSLSWSYTAGAYYVPQKVFGSLTFGGYDTSRFVPNDLTITRGDDISRDLLVGIQAIGSESDSLLPEPIIAYIDSTVSALWLPEAACKRFEEVFGLVLDEETGLYLVNDTLHSDLQSKNPSITFTIGASQTGGEIVNISMPYGAFDLTAKYPLTANDSSSYFPIRRAQNDTQYVLGRTFLQQAYITVDYDRNTFQVSQAIFPGNGVKQKLVPIVTPGSGSGSNGASTGPLSSSSSSNGISTGAVAGIAVGVTIIALAAIGGGLFWFFWRRRKAKKAAEKNAEIDPNAPQPGEPKTDHSQPPNEVQGDSMVKNELAGSHGRYRSTDNKSELVGSGKYASEIEGDSRHASELGGSGKFASEMHGDTMYSSEIGATEDGTHYTGGTSETGRTLPSYPGTPSELHGDTGASELESRSSGTGTNTGLQRQWRKLAGLHEMA